MKNYNYPFTFPPSYANVCGDKWAISQIMSNNFFLSLQSFNVNESSLSPTQTNCNALCGNFPETSYTRKRIRLLIFNQTLKLSVALTRLRSAKFRMQKPQPALSQTQTAPETEREQEIKLSPQVVWTRLVRVDGWLRRWSISSSTCTKSARRRMNAFLMCSPRATRSSSLLGFAF